MVNASSEFKNTSAVNFINVKHTNFSYEHFFLWLRLAWCQKFAQKTRAKNVDKIDTLRVNAAEGIIFYLNFVSNSTRIKLL